MKAEHRKELETNLLAEKMGDFVSRVKTGPENKRSFYLALFLGFAAVVVLAIGWIYYTGKSKDEAENWWAFELGERKELLKLAAIPESKDKDVNLDAPANVRNAARFQLAWFWTWEEGIKSLGANWRGALNRLKAAEGLYNILAEECKGDLVWYGEAKYGLAVITETRAILDRKNLKTAIDQFDGLAEEMKEKSSAHAELAAQRARYLRENLAQVEQFYQDLQTKFGVDPSEKTPSLKN